METTTLVLMSHNRHILGRIRPSNEVDSYAGRSDGERSTRSNSRSNTSGAAAITAIQLIDACIGNTKVIVDIGNAVRDAQGLPPKLRALVE
nr:hypothetical protein CFP56_76157 [Quercus suber]